jgi:hypothetical protein
MLAGCESGFGLKPREPIAPLALCGAAPVESGLSRGRTAPACDGAGDAEGFEARIMHSRQITDRRAQPNACERRSLPIASSTPSTRSTAAPGRSIRPSQGQRPIADPRGKRTTEMPFTPRALRPRVAIERLPMHSKSSWQNPTRAYPLCKVTRIGPVSAPVCPRQLRSKIQSHSLASTVSPYFTGS